MKKIIGKFWGLLNPPFSGLWTILIKTKTGIKSFAGDWRPLRAMMTDLELKKGDRIIVNFKEKWDWSIKRVV